MMNHKIQMTKTILSVLGCLGIGKTTFVKHLSEKVPNAIYVDEPVEQWLSIKDSRTGENLLERAYKDPHRWTYTFQNMAFITRLNLLMKAIDSEKSDLIVMDGSLATDKNMYAQMLHDDGFMDPIEWESYNLWENFYENQVKKNEVIYVYMRCDPQIIMNRIKHRGRPEEKNLNIQYLIKLQHYLDHWFKTVEKSNKVYTFDFSCDEDDEKYGQILDQVIKLLQLGGRSLPRETP